MSSYLNLLLMRSVTSTPLPACDLLWTPSGSLSSFCSHHLRCAASSLSLGVRRAVATVAVGRKEDSAVARQHQNRKRPTVPNIFIAVFALLSGEDT